MQKEKLNCLKRICYACLPFFFSIITYAQQPDSIKVKTKTPKRVTSFMNSIALNDADVLGTRTKYIQNIGQYGDTLAGYGAMGKILFGYEGAGMPVLFTSKGAIHVQRKTTILSYKEREELKEKGLNPDKRKSVEQVITMQWLNANPDPRIVTERLSKAYFTYGLLKEKAKAYKKITSKEIYPGIDLVYSFILTTKVGYEYSLLVKPGADISKIKMRYGGDIKNISADATGNLVIVSAIDEIHVSAPVMYYADAKDQKINASFLINGNEIGFKLPENYDPKRTLIIDPFVSPTTTLNGGMNPGEANDIDFDYDGNIYVSGGGDDISQKLVKFDKNGVVQWTFSGTLTVPSWTFGPSHGGWVVEKTSGNIYLGQGLANNGFSVIRLNSSGVYDNYMTTPNPNFGENWKMLWSCNGGTPKILIAGGGGNANNELAILTPPNLVPATSNISGLTGGHNDISDIIIDPVTNEMFTIFSVSVSTPGINSKIYKHTPPYAVANKAWTAGTGYFSVSEPYNRPYSGGIDNSSNTIAINNNYVFYWDGKNLKAFNKATGNAAGTEVNLPSTIMMQGGIFADECNNIFIGYTDGTIKVYKFDGSTFNDAAVADIIIPGFTSKSVFDLVYDHATNMIYTCGDGFVASIDVSSYCAAPVYTLNVVTNVQALTATATLTPAAPAGSTVTFSLFNGSLLITSNTTGIFTGLSVGITYTIKAFINQACGGTQVTKDFILNAPLPTGIPGIYVPNAFTPNSNSTNDILKVILYGMRELRSFSIYNRYGELVFTSTDPAIGWDGTFKGKAQNAGTFVWMAEAVDLRGNIVQEKGTTMVIR